MGSAWPLALVAAYKLHVAQLLLEACDNAITCNGNRRVVLKAIASKLQERLISSASLILTIA